MSDFNAKIGKEKMETSFGLGDRNARGDRLEQFYEEGYFVMINTMFKLPPRHFVYIETPKGRKRW